MYFHFNESNISKLNMHWCYWGVFLSSQPSFLVSKPYSLQGYNAFVDNVFMKGWYFLEIVMSKSNEGELVVQTQEVHEG